MNAFKSCSPPPPYPPTHLHPATPPPSPQLITWASYPFLNPLSTRLHKHQICVVGYRRDDKFQSVVLLLFCSLVEHFTLCVHNTALALCQGCFPTPTFSSFRPHTRLSLAPLLARLSLVPASLGVYSPPLDKVSFTCCLSTLITIEWKLFVSKCEFRVKVGEL